MAHQQVSQTEQKWTSLGKGYGACGCSRHPIGSEDDVSVWTEDCLDPPWKSNTSVGIAMSWGTSSGITVKWNWPAEQTRSLPISSLQPRPTLSDWWLFFCCSVCLLVWSAANGYQTYREGGKMWIWRKGGRIRGHNTDLPKISVCPDVKPAENLPSKAAQQIYPDLKMRGQNKGHFLILLFSSFSLYILYVMLEDVLFGELKGDIFYVAGNTLIFKFMHRKHSEIFNWTKLSPFLYCFYYICSEKNNIEWHLLVANRTVSFLKHTIKHRNMCSVQTWPLNTRFLLEIWTKGGKNQHVIIHTSKETNVSNENVVITVIRICLPSGLVCVNTLIVKHLLIKLRSGKNVDYWVGRGHLEVKTLPQN